MNNKLKLGIFSVIMIVVMVVSCKKNEDDQPPQIVITLPQQNSLFSFEDTIPVSFTVSDNEKVENVRVSLVNLQLDPVPGTVRYFYPGSRNNSISTEICTAYEFAEPGEYYVMVTASDGFNTSNAYCNVSMSGDPYSLLGILVVARESNFIKVSRFDTLWNKILLFETQGDYVASGIQAKYKNIYLAGSEILNLEARNVDSGQPEWLVEPGIDLPYHVENSLFTDDDLYVTFGRHYIRRYSAQGQVRFTIQVNEMETPGAITRAGDYVIVERKGTSNFQSYIAAYYAGTGMMLNQAPVFYDVKTLIPVSGNEVLMFCSNGNDNSVKRYLLDEGKVFDYALLPSGSITFCEQLPDNIILCGIGESVYGLNTDTGFYWIIPQLEGVSAVRYEKIRSTVYAVSGTALNVYNYPSFSLLNSYVAGTGVQNIHLLYNR